MNNFCLKSLLDKIFSWKKIYIYTYDYTLSKIIIFYWRYIIEVSLKNSLRYTKKSKLLYFYIYKFDNLNNILNFINNKDDDISNSSVANIVKLIIQYEQIIYDTFLNEINSFFESNYKDNNTKKEILIILKWWGFEEIIEKNFISYCNYFKINLTVLYKFWFWFWWQPLNQEWYINELMINNPNVKFIYQEWLDDEFIDSIINQDTEIFSLKYYYRGKSKKFNLMIDWSMLDNFGSDWVLADSDINHDCTWYKNIFTCYMKRNHVWYITDSFINYENVKLNRFFLPQDCTLINNYSIINLDNQGDIILSWWMTWARDFSILNSLDWKYKWIMVSDENHDIKWFLDNYRWIQNYYWFLWAFILSTIWVFCHLEEYNNDDRTKMIITSICSWKPVVVPYNDWLLVETIVKNKLWVTYKNWDTKDFKEKVKFLIEDKIILNEYKKNCLDYSKVNFNIVNFINTIFNKI